MRSLQAPAAGSSRAASRRRARALRSARAAGVSGRDRGEWTRFLELSSEGGRPASVEVSLQPSGAAAEVTVVAPDRAGLLSDITTAITQAGLSIAKAKVSTPSKESAGSSFVVTCEGGQPLTGARLAAVRSAIIVGASKGYNLSGTAQGGRPFVGVDASVEVMSFQADPASRPAWIITVECDDRPGLLAATVGALRVLEINVLSADVRTHQGTATNRFQVELREGLRPQAVVDALKAAIKGGAGGAA